MKYALLLCTNGTFSVAANYGENKQAGIVGFHQRCATLWNTEDVKTATVKLVDDQLDTVDGKMELIVHPDPEPEEQEKPEAE